MADFNQYLMSLRLDGKYDELVEHAKDELERDLNNPILWEMLADAYLNTNRLASAVRASLSCLKIQPSNQLCFCYLTISYLRLRDFPNCFNAVSSTFNALDESHKWFLFEEFTLALEAGVVTLEELPVEMRIYAESKAKKMRTTDSVANDPRGTFQDALRNSNLILAAKAANADLHNFAFPTLLNLISKNEIVGFENLLRMGWPVLTKEDRVSVEDQLKNQKTDKFDVLIKKYRLMRDEPQNSTLDTAMNIFLRSVFRFPSQYERDVVADIKNRRLRFNVGALEVKSGIFDELLPDVLGLVPWQERIDAWDSADFFSKLGSDESSAGDIVVLTSERTGLSSTALKADIDAHMDEDHCSWAIWEVWQVSVLSQPDFLRLLGDIALKNGKPIIAFNYLSESTIDPKMEFRTGQDGIFDRAKHAYSKGCDFAYRKGLLPKSS